MFNNKENIKIDNLILKSLCKFDVGNNKSKIWLSSFHKDFCFNDDHLISLNLSGLLDSNLKRKVEFLASRELIKFVLSEQYSTEFDVYKGSLGEPLWLYNYNGSISHNKNYVTVIIEKERLVGIDIETIFRDSSTKSIIKMILNDSERKLLLNSSDVNLLVTLIFSAKETLYKAFNIEAKVKINIKSFELLTFNDNFLIFKPTKTIDIFEFYNEIVVNYIIINLEVITWVSLEKKHNSFFKFKQI